jgi:hypothetical protein
VDDYKDIGMLLHRISPDITESLHNVLARRPQPELTDLSIIPKLFTGFCHYKNIDGIDSKKLTKKEYVYLRRVFIGVIIKLYNPDMLTPYGALRVTWNLSVALAHVLKTHRSWVCESYGIVCTRLKVYPEFEEDVLSTLQHVRNIGSLKKFFNKK